MEDTIMTVAVVRRWGNSLALRIPREIAATLNLTEATEVELSTQDGRLVVEPCHHPELELDDMLKACKPAHFRRTTEERKWLAAAPVGRELL
jgi:antitoxin component of MazEF toxin-antitoxin module